MRYILSILLGCILVGIGYGFYIKSSDQATGDLFIGLSMVALFFILMPTFIYHRWKNKDVKDYMLNKENIEKMRDYTKDKKL